MPSSHLILCHVLLLLPPNPSQHQSLFQSLLATFSHRWPKYWSFSFSISPSNKHPRLISFKMDWLDLLAVQGILKSLLQHHSSKASILWRSAFSLLDCLIPHYDCLISPYFTTQIPENTNRINLACPGLSSVFYTRLPHRSSTGCGYRVRSPT